MKLRLVGNETYPIERAEIVDGRLEIDFKEKTAEEVQSICDNPGNLDKIELLTDADEVFSVLDGWTKYGGVTLNGEIKTALLSQPANITEERVTSAEAATAEVKQTVKAQAAIIKKIEKQTVRTNSRSRICSLHYVKYMRDWRCETWQQYMQR